jgi:hypothetical protein
MLTVVTPGEHGVRERQEMRYCAMGGETRRA